MTERITPGLLAILLFSTVAHGTLAAQEKGIVLDTVQVAVGTRTLATLPAVARSVEVLDRAALQRIPARTVPELLAWITGADVLARSPALADLALRGSSFEQVVVLVDGVNVSDDQTGHFDLDLAVPLESVERIEVMRGEGSALYGPDAVGGTINIVTAPVTNSRLHAEGGSFGTALVEGDGSAQAGSARVHGGGTWSRSDGHRAGTDYRVRLARGGGDLPVGGGQLRGDLGYGARDFGANDFYGPWDSYEETRALTASLRWQPPASRRFSITPGLSLRRHHDDFILLRNDPSVYENLHTNWRVASEVVARYLASPAVRLAAGGSADRMILRSERLGHLDESRAAAFGELTAGDPARAVLTTGARLDWHSVFGSFVSPSVAGAWRVRPALRLRASAGRGFRAPTWTERFYRDPANIGNPDLQPERFWSGEAGFTLAPERRVSIDLAAFLRHADRLIDWGKPAGASATTPWETTNIENATFRGLELRTTLAALLGADWTLRATTLSFSDDETSGLTSKYALRPLTETASAEASFLLPGHVSLWARAGRARRVGEHAYTLLDTRLGYTRRGVTLYLDATNLTDASYLDVSALPAAGQAFHLGVRLEGRSPTAGR